MMNEDRLIEIKDTLLNARNSFHYNTGSPTALDHLLVHVVYLIDGLIEDERKSAPTPELETDTE